MISTTRYIPVCTAFFALGGCYEPVHNITFGPKYDLGCDSSEEIIAVYEQEVDTFVDRVNARLAATGQTMTLSASLSCDSVVVERSEIDPVTQALVANWNILDMAATEDGFEPPTGFRRIDTVDLQQVVDFYIPSMLDVGSTLVNVDWTLGGETVSNLVALPVSEVDIERSLSPVMYMARFGLGATVGSAYRAVRFENGFGVDVAGYSAQLVCAGGACNAASEHRETFGCWLDQEHDTACVDNTCVTSYAFIGMCGARGASFDSTTFEWESGADWPVVRYFDQYFQLTPPE